TRPHPRQTTPAAVARNPQLASPTSSSPRPKTAAGSTTAPSATPPTRPLCLKRHCARATEPSQLPPRYASPLSSPPQPRLPPPPATPDTPTPPITLTINAHLFDRKGHADTARAAIDTIHAALAGTS